MDLMQCIKKYMENEERYEDIILRVLNSLGYSNRDWLDNLVVILASNNKCDFFGIDEKTRRFITPQFKRLVDKKYIKRMGKKTDKRNITSFYTLTFKGAFRVFNSIRERRKVAYMKKAFAICQEEGWYQHIPDDVAQFVRESNKNHGPFFNYDDPANSNSQEFLMEILG